MRRTRDNNEGAAMSKFMVYDARAPTPQPESLRRVSHHRDPRLYPVTQTSACRSDACQLCDFICSICKRMLPQSGGTALVGWALPVSGCGAPRGVLQPTVH